MSLTITITDAGRAALVNAENSGTAPVTISEIALGSGQYTPTESQTALTNEFKRIDTISGEVVSDDTINVVLKDESSDDYQVGEFGLYTNGGVLFAVYSQPSADGWVAEKFAGSSFLLAVDVVLETLDATSLTFGDITFTNPPASETVKGVIEIADDSEAWAGEDDVKVMTPKKTRMVGVPPGALMAFPMTSAPTGYLKCNGAAVSRSTYAALFAEIGTVWGAGDGSTTFNLPDYRGEFIRGLDDGRGVDPFRSLGSHQSDELKSHSHSGSTSTAGSHRHPYSRSDYQNDNSGPLALNGDGSIETFYTEYEGSHNHSLIINSTGGAETRPRNHAALICIKY